MPDFFDIVFGPGAKAVRRDAQVRLTVDADGNPALEPVGGKAVTLSPDGSIDSVQVTPDRFYHCGCSAQAPMGGRCGEPGCNRVSCQSCFTRCHACGKPLCLEHRRKLVLDVGEFPACARCHGQLSRKRALRGLARGVLRPFVDFGGPKSP